MAPTTLSPVKAGEVMIRALRDRHGAEGLFLAATTGLLREKRPGTLLQAVSLQQADHRQDDPGDRNVAIVIERLAKGFGHSDEIEAGK